jgi:hypothetical protein
MAALQRKDPLDKVNLYSLSALVHANAADSYQNLSKNIFVSPTAQKRHYV